MNPIRLLRAQTGLTQHVLATIAGTSQPTIALYESGAKSPTLATLQRLSQALGMELAVSFVPALTREDQRSLAYHRVVVKKIQDNPTEVIAQAKRTLAKMRQKHPGAHLLLTRWREWLSLEPQELITKILDAGVVAREMRQVTPFAGVLSPRERAAILKQFRKEFQYEAQRV